MITAWVTCLRVGLGLDKMGATMWWLRGMDAALLRVRAGGRYIGRHFVEYGG